MRLQIKGGRVIDPANQMDGVHDVCIDDGKIVSIGMMPDSFQADYTIHADNKIVCPGIIDLRARLREPGFEHKASIASETTAAAAAGITTLCCPPDTDPTIDTPAVLDLINHRAQRVNKARVVAIGALTLGLRGEHLSEMGALRQAGCVGVGNALMPIDNTLVIRRAMEYAASHDLTVFLHSQESWLSRDGYVHEGSMSMRLGLAGIPDIAETIAVGRDLALIEHTGVKAHFCQLSTARGVRMVARAQHEGLPVTADVTAHHLHLTEMDIGEFDGFCHVQPPFRTSRDRDGLRQGLLENVISAICSDHQPHEFDAKLGPFVSTEPGISALETLLPLSLRLVQDRLLSLSEVIARLTVYPAKILGLNLGSLTPGMTADICIYDPNEWWTITEDNIISQGKNSPCIGWELQGRVHHTLLNGQLVYSHAGCEIVV